jgi:3-oxoacyl-[acyl-carrier-protein] synthase III|tara:strand:- start:405 stop:557 length:153 start_codon:yes stop_codon:yes gene_type:complete
LVRAAPSELQNYKNKWQKKVGVSLEQAVLSLKKYCKISAATLPTALDTAI